MNQVGFDSHQAGADKSTARDKLQLSFLNEAQIVFSTLSGSGMRVLNDLERGFDRCIVDEAGQCVELSVLIPLRLRVRSCILVGDPRQLPATCFLNGKTFAFWLLSALKPLFHAL